MSAGTTEQLRLRARNGSMHELEFLADTGCPCAFVVSEARLAELGRGVSKPADSNFGPLVGGWLRLAVLELGLDEFVLGYASEEIVADTKQNSPDFEGLVGLPVLRLGEYGGDGDSFWFRARKRPM